LASKKVKLTCYITQHIVFYYNSHRILDKRKQKTRVIRSASLSIDARLSIADPTSGWCNT